MNLHLVNAVHPFPTALPWQGPKAFGRSMHEMGYGALCDLRDNLKSKNLKGFRVYGF